MLMQPYIFFKNNCAEAMRFYEKTLGGKLDMLPFKNMPDFEKQFPAEMGELIMHARLAVGEQVLMASDNGSPAPYEGMKGFSVTLSYPDIAEGERVFKALSEGGEVTMPFGETFWVERFGMLKDRFGTPWFVNAGKPKL